MSKYLSINFSDKAVDHDTPSVIGGFAPPEELQRPLAVFTDVPTDDLGLHIARLLALHPELNSLLGGTSLKDLNENKKWKLLNKINEHLKIRPPRTRRPNKVYTSLSEPQVNVKQTLAAFGLTKELCK
jgi:hypothetical protein